MNDRVEEGLLCCWMEVSQVCFLSGHHVHGQWTAWRPRPRERKIRGLNPACGRIFSELSHTSDLKIGTPVATLPGTWRYRVSVGAGWPGVSIL